MNEKSAITGQHEVALKKIYAAWTENQISRGLDQVSANFSFQIPGKGKLAGKFKRDEMESKLWPLFTELSSGTYQFKIHDILCSELHGTVLGSHHFKKGGQDFELRTVHVWRFEKGQALAGYEYPRDLYQFETFFG